MRIEKLHLKNKGENTQSKRVKYLENLNNKN
jgi:hypothetical protein